MEHAPPKARANPTKLKKFKFAKYFWKGGYLCSSPAPCFLYSRELERILITTFQCSRTFRTTSNMQDTNKLPIRQGTDDLPVGQCFTRETAITRGIPMCKDLQDHLNNGPHRGREQRASAPGDEGVTVQSWSSPRCPVRSLSEAVGLGWKVGRSVLES